MNSYRFLKGVVRRYVFVVGPNFTSIPFTTAPMKDTGASINDDVEVCLLPSNIVH